MRLSPGRARSMRAGESIRVRVVYALPDRQSIVDLVVASQTTVEQAVQRSGLMVRFTEIGLQPLKCAIFGRVVNASDTLTEGDRIEILRPLLVDPKESRREAAERSRKASQKAR